MRQYLLRRVAFGVSTLVGVSLIIFGGLIILFLAIEPEGLYRLWGNVRRYFRLWPFSY